MDALQATVKSSSEVMVNLFKGYLAALDKGFVTYIKQKTNGYEEAQDLSDD